MRPAVVTAVLLLVGILNTGTVVHGCATAALKLFCDTYVQDRPCSDGWSFIDKGLCMKYINNAKNFNDAEEHCKTLSGHLVSLHDLPQMYHVLCLTIRADSELHPVWIGAKKAAGGDFTNTDGSAFDYNLWSAERSNSTEGKEGCIESNFKDWGFWNDADCSQQKSFVCAKTV